MLKVLDKMSDIMNMQIENIQLLCGSWNLYILGADISFSLVNSMGNIRMSEKCRYHADLQIWKIQCVIT